MNPESSASRDFTPEPPVPQELSPKTSPPHMPNVFLKSANKRVLFVKQQLKNIKKPIYFDLSDFNRTIFFKTISHIFVYNFLKLLIFW